MKISTLLFSLLAGIVPALERREAPCPPDDESRSTPSRGLPTAASSSRLQPGRRPPLAEIRFPLLPPPLT